MLAKYGKHTKELLRPVKGIRPVPGIGEETFPDYIINVEYDRYAKKTSPPSSIHL